MLSTVAVLCSAGGTFLLFRYGAPFKVRSGDSHGLSRGIPLSGADERERRKSDSLGWLGLALGMFGAGVQVALAWLPDMATFARPDGDGLLYRWQTLEAGALAIVAAFIGARAVLGQTRAVDRREAQRLAAQATAVRALLPHLLSFLIGYTRDCAKTLQDLSRAPRDGTRVLPRPAFTRLPELPENIPRQLAEAVERGGSTPRDRLAAILVALQVHRARLLQYQEALEGYGPSLLVLADNLAGSAVDTAEVYALVSSLFPYGRGWTEDPPAPLKNTDLSKAASSLGLFDYYDLRERLHLQDGEMLWDAKE